MSFFLFLSLYIYICVCVCVTSVIDIIKKNDEKKEMEKINVNNQILVYKFIWYIPFEDWSFDDIIYTLVGSIVTVCFALHLSKHYTYLTIDYIQQHTHILKKDKAHLKRIITLFLVWLFTHTFSLSLLFLPSFDFITHTDHLRLNDKDTSSSIRYQDIFLEISSI